MMEPGIQDFAFRVLCMAAADLAQDEARAAQREAAAALRTAEDGTGAPHRLAAITAAAADFTGFSVATLRGRGRHRPLARARMLAMYLARELTPLSLSQIGRYFDRDHTTVLHGCREIAAAAGGEAALRDRMMVLLADVLKADESALG